MITVNARSTSGSVTIIAPGSGLIVLLLSFTGTAPTGIGGGLNWTNDGITYARPQGYGLQTWSAPCVAGSYTFTPNQSVAQIDCNYLGGTIDAVGQWSTELTVQSAYVTPAHTTAYLFATAGLDRLQPVPTQTPQSGFTLTGSGIDWVTSEISNDVGGTTSAIAISMGSSQVSALWGMFAYAIMPNGSGGIPGSNIVGVGNVIRRNDLSDNDVVGVSYVRGMQVVKGFSQFNQVNVFDNDDTRMISWNGNRHVASPYRPRPIIYHHRVAVSDESVIVNSDYNTFIYVGPRRYFKKINRLAMRHRWAKR